MIDAVTGDRSAIRGLLRDAVTAEALLVIALGHQQRTHQNYRTDHRCEISKSFHRHSPSRRLKRAVKHSLIPVLSYRAVVPSQFGSSLSAASAARASSTASRYQPWS